MQAFGAWLQHHEALRLQQAAEHHAAACRRRVLVAWQQGMALCNRKRVLTAEGAQQHSRRMLQRGLSGWMRWTYYKHMGHVALHFRMRRLGCVVTQQWAQVRVRWYCCLLHPGLGSS